MMRRIRGYITLLTCIIITGCNSNDFGPQLEQKMVTAQEEVSNQIMLENLSDVDPEICLQLAKQKLIDLEDYMNLLMDDEVDDEFKTNINGQIEGLIYFTYTPLESQIVLANWIKQQIDEEDYIEFMAVQLLEESVKKENEELTFTIHLKVKKKRSKNQKVRFQFSIKKIEKAFGDDVVKLEEVKLIGLEIDQ